MDFCSRVNDFIVHHQLLKADGRYLVALSGGADSVALLRVLLQLGYRVEAVHCNFRLRGEESDRDEAFCRALCQRLDVKFHCVHFDTKAYAELHKVSIEMAARELRYHYFEQLRLDIQADGICVAHHQDDQSETILLNIVRGTGLKGLQGMHPRNGFIIRPLLNVTRQDILDYLSSLQQDYVTDSTNLIDEAQRNIIRLDVMPQLRRINPAVAQNIARMAEHVSEASAFIEQSADEALRTMKTADGGYNLTQLLRHPSVGLLMWQLLSPFGFNEQQIDEMGQNQRNGSQWMSKSHVATIDRQRLYIYNKEAWSQEPPEMRIPEAGTYVYGEDGIRFKLSKIAVDEHFALDKRAEVANLDAEKVTMPLTIRGLRSGDRFQPFGMRGTKLISDYLTDRKRSLMEKRRQLVVSDAMGRIVWLVGERVDGRVAITSSTCFVLRIEVSGLVSQTV